VEITVLDLLNSAFSNGRREAEISNKLFVNEVAYNNGNVKICEIILLKNEKKFAWIYELKLRSECMIKRKLGKLITE
jgi:hypothetical protein